MSTSAVNHTGNATVTTTGGKTQMNAGKFALNAGDFINMMVTQLENQDPLQPASNQELLSQMSNIGQLQTTSDLQTTLTGLATQSSIGSASNLIGKHVDGLDDNGAPLGGTVMSVSVAGTTASLQLDNGSSLTLAQVTKISPATQATASN